ncbi:MAG: hypothetical protein NZ901_03610 [Geminocystis sp.]|nr:hypothetical protein [Geminocystis sp.]HIK37718.1 hypothetical protein [Geminocystis sp. M7585_C2015_104]MCS7147258.1 hypothetical protein [Geminocystis sp.]MCX8078516.1 hypothetical protein [Geminocystis sp.]MDW8116255.1 hypothetical protein [Geminocystis sp.]
MSHTFLLESGAWVLEGSWLDKAQVSVPCKGAIIIGWEEQSWFSLQMKLVFPQSMPRYGNFNKNPHITFHYKGNIATGRPQYAFVLKRSDVEKIEGEGWITDYSIIQRYWVLGSNMRLHGVETFYHLEENTYHLTSIMMTGNNLLYTLEAILQRHR